MATRVRTYDLLGTARAVAERLPNLFSLEMWGGATFDTALRFLHEDPGSVCGNCALRCPISVFRCCARGECAGYASTPDNVIRGLCAKRTPRHGLFGCSIR
jgi:pyruvate carboxylase